MMVMMTMFLKVIKKYKDDEQEPSKSVMFNSSLHHNPAILELTFES